MWVITGMVQGSCRPEVIVKIIQNNGSQNFVVCQYPIIQAISIYLKKWTTLYFEEYVAVVLKVTL